MDTTKKDSPILDFTFPDDGGRPLIEEYDTEYKFLPNDEVQLRDPETRKWRGPYIVSCTRDGKYELQDEDGKKLNDGELFEESELKPYDPFE